MIENSLALLRLIITAKAMDKSFSNIVIENRIRKPGRSIRGLISFQQKITVKLHIRVTKIDFKKRVSLERKTQRGKRK